MKGEEAKCPIVSFPNLAQSSPEELCHFNRQQLPRSIYVKPSKNLVWRPKQGAEDVPPGQWFIKGSTCSLHA